MNNTTAFFGHLRNIFVHKWWVFYYACKCGIPVRGFMHDWSKLSPIEFWESVRYYQGTSSPIPACKKVNGWSKAWQHHKAHNPHHYEYWTDNYDTGTTAIRMPYKYAVEMICDYLAAGRTYHGKGFTFTDELRWWQERKKTAKMHPDTIAFVDDILNYLAVCGDVLGEFVLKHAYQNNIND